MPAPRRVQFDQVLLDQVALAPVAAGELTLLSIKGQAGPAAHAPETHSRLKHERAKRCPAAHAPESGVQFLDIIFVHVPRPDALTSDEKGLRSTQTLCPRRARARDR
jgi:hypothetical protein